MEHAQEISLAILIWIQVFPAQSVSEQFFAMYLLVGVSFLSFVDSTLTPACIVARGSS